MHDDEIEISAELVRRLIDRDLPRFSASPLRRLAASGSTNVLFRLGANHLVRLPRQPGGSGSIETEARWLARLAPALPVAVPEVVAVGRPGFGYPEGWSVTRWIDGELPATPYADGPAANALARQLAEFVEALHAAEVTPSRFPPRRMRSLAGSTPTCRGRTCCCATGAWRRCSTSAAWPSATPASTLLSRGMSWSRGPVGCFGPPWASTTAPGYGAVPGRSR